jgi:hypothetical protein
MTRREEMTRRENILRGLILAVAMVMLAIPLSATVPGSDHTAPGRDMTFSGTIVTFDGVTRRFTLKINGLTSENEARDDLSALRSGGQDGFSKAIEKRDLGFFALNGEVGHDLRYVTETRTESGTKIVAVFDRWMRPFELRYGTRSSDYPFTYIELFVKNDGNVTGTIIGAARVKVDESMPGSLDFENFAAYPAKLVGVSVSKPDAV